MALKYHRPDFLLEKLEREAYESWLRRKALAHVKRDRERGNTTATIQEYKEAVHLAVVGSRGLDCYTGEGLDWSLCGKYRNAEAKAGGSTYKAKFALLPTIDHVGDGLGAADFKICSWRTNDAKNDLKLEDFVELCRLVLQHSDNSHTPHNSEPAQ